MPSAFEFAIVVSVAVLGCHVAPVEELEQSAGAAGPAVIWDAPPLCPSAFHVVTTTGAGELALSVNDPESRGGPQAVYVSSVQSPPAAHQLWWLIWNTPGSGEFALRTALPPHNRLSVVLDARGADPSLEHATGTAVAWVLQRSGSNDAELDAAAKFGESSFELVPVEDPAASLAAEWSAPFALHYASRIESGGAPANQLWSFRGVEWCMNGLQ